MSDDRQAALLEANAAFYRAFEKKDMDAMERVCSKGASCLCAHPGREPIRGWDAIRQSWVRIFRGTQYLEIDLDSVWAEVSGDWGCVVVVETVMQVSGRRRIQARSLATNLFEYMGGRWYLIHHHGSPLAS